MSEKSNIILSPSFLERLVSAEHLCVLTGAGVSAESGVPTFRSAGGLWEAYDPRQLATEQAFRSDPDLVWGWYSWRRSLIAAVEPNPGHHALAEFTDIFRRMSLITQNVDNLHQRAGSREVHELHGNIERSRCIECGRGFPGDEAPRTPKALLCPCGGYIRPGVVWFGEMLPEDELRFAQSAASECDIFLTVGTSGQVYPAADLPVQARRRGAYVVEINPEPSAIAHLVDECLTMPSGIALPAILEAARKTN